MISSPGNKINRYYEHLENPRERDEARNRPLIEETDVVELFKHLGFQATTYQEKLLQDKSHFVLAAGRGRVARASRWRSRSSSTLSPVEGSGPRLLLRASGRV